MKRFGNLWPQIIDFENLILSARNAQAGKKFRENILKFNYNLEQELIQLQSELQNRTYQPGDYRTFRIREPKSRLISAAPYRDRVVHHALCNVVLPIFERTFIDDSYANRVGYGTHRALKRFAYFTARNRYVLQCDIQKYFPNIDHQILKQIIRQKIKCPDTLWLIDLIIDSGNPQESSFAHFLGDDLLDPVQRRKGLPIGNLTSQSFANIYLNGFDHFIKEQIKANSYLRYVDDFALFSDDLYFLADARIAIEQYLTALRLRIHPIKSQLFETRLGASFVGFRLIPDGDKTPKKIRIRVRSHNLSRARHRLRRLRKAYALGIIKLDTVAQSLQSWSAHLKHGHTHHLRQKIFSSLYFVKQ